jgi:hypothetical protein
MNTKSLMENCALCVWATRTLRNWTKDEDFQRFSQQIYERRMDFASKTTCNVFFFSNRIQFFSQKGVTKMRKCNFCENYKKVAHICENFAVHSWNYRNKIDSFGNSFSDLFPSKFDDFFSKEFQEFENFWLAFL